MYYNTFLLQPGVPAGSYIVPAYYEQGAAPILVAQGAAAAAAAAVRNGHAPMRLVSPAAPVLVPPPGAAPGRAAQGVAAGLYGAAASAQGIYGAAAAAAAAAGVNTSVNGTTLGGNCLFFVSHMYLFVNNDSMYKTTQSYCCFSGCAVIALMKRLMFNDISLK